jgi:hypothetical protein
VFDLRTGRLLVLLLRIAGVVTACAFAAVLLPVEWMAATHRWLGLGEMPRSAIFDYLARSVAALYGFHGVLLLTVAANPFEHRTIVRYIAAMNVGFGLVMVAIDLQAGLPLLWVLAEGPPIVAFGIIVFVLERALPARAPAHQPV